MGILGTMPLSVERVWQATKGSLTASLVVRNYHVIKADPVLAWTIDMNWVIDARPRLKELGWSLVLAERTV